MALPYPPLSEMIAEQRREFHEALLEANTYEDLPGKWQAAILKAEQGRPNLRVLGDDRTTAPQGRERSTGRTNGQPFAYLESVRV